MKENPNIYYKKTKQSDIQKDISPMPYVTERRFSIVFGVQHFQEYLYSREFTIINDHQPI